MPRTPARTLAAAATPLRAGGAELDEEAFEPLTQFLVRGGLDGLLALGTTGEGIALSVAERRRAAELFLRSAPAGLLVFVHCGAQTTADTVALARHAAEAGAAAVAVIAPPYFALDERALLAHFRAAADACAPLPFYVYEFERTSGYAIPVAVIEALRESAPNLTGLKVSDAPWERLAPYLIDGLEVFVGAEGLIHRAVAAGAAGAVSGLATVFPEAVVAAVRSAGAIESEKLARLRGEVDRFPRHAVLKLLLAQRGVPIGEDVRAPLRRLTAQEREEVDGLLPGWWELTGLAAAPAG